jgi:hypothetical protein
VGIQFLHRNAIDDRLWNRVIEGSAAETIYPYSWYLDSVAGHWSALIGDNYRYLMPLVWKRKYGVAYIYQPFYTQQLGIFSEEHVDPTIITEMILKIPWKFRMGQLQFNSRNLVSHLPSVQVTDRLNYILELNGSYEQLEESFSMNTRRNLKKAYSHEAVVDKSMTIRELVAFKRQHDVISRSEKEYTWLIELLENIMDRGAGTIYATGMKGHPDAAAFFAYSKKRAIYLLSVSSDTGKERRSMFRIVDTFLREHAGTPLTLDFEGSNIPTVARFFSGFGAAPEVYQAVGFRRFPFTMFRT